jgi:SAM-dependent methyltransferase
MIGKSKGEIVKIAPGPGSFTDAYDHRRNFNIRNAQFNRRFFADKDVTPRTGRFYPRGILKGIAGIFPQNVQPFRCVGNRNGRLRVDLNHPLATRALNLTAVVKDVKEKISERGGRCHDWLDIVATGPGMQCRWNNQPTDFFSKNAFQREDELSDRHFYQKPRLVQHIDDTAIEVVENLYGRFIKNGMRVLDLMASWKSHIPAGFQLDKLTGLGLNSEELNANNELSDRITHDLNINPMMPFETESYDVVVCTVSMEYLTHPLAVFREIGRVLRPNGPFIVTFSNRWFPTKAIKVWEELHEFERMGLVLEYFHQSGCFQNLETFSIRNLPRPPHDKYYNDIIASDPIFAVWGRKV